MKPVGIWPVSTAVLVALDGAAAVMSEDHDQRHAEHADAVLQRAEYGVVDHLAGGADDEGVPQAEVEDDLCRKPGIRAAEDHGERVLVLNKRGTAGRVLVGVQRIRRRRSVRFLRAVGAMPVLESGK